MEEKELFGEIKPLIEEYKEYANKETLNMWDDILEDIEISDKSREEGKVYTSNRELEIMKMLEVMDARRKLVKELLDIRKTKMTQMRSTIFKKVGAFINDSKEKMNQEIEERRQELEEKKEEKRENFEKKQQELEQKQQLRRDMNKRSEALTKYLQLMEHDLGKDDKVYMAVGEEKIQARREKENLSREINALEKECETLKFEYEDFSIENDERLQELVNRLNEFDNTYGKIDFESEDAIQYIGEMVENYKEEDEIHKLTEDEVEVEEPEKVVTMEDLEQIKEEEKKAWEIYDEENKKQEEKNKKQIEEEWKKHDEKDEKPAEAKQKTTTEKQANAQTKAGAQKPIGANPKPTNAKPTETKQSCKETLRVGISKGEEEQVEVKVQAEDMDPVFDMQEKQILIEEREQRLAELKAGFEDIVEVDGNYIALENNLRSYESIEDIEWVLQSLEGKNILDIYEGMLAQEEIPKEIEYLKNIIKQLEERAENLDLEKLVNEFPKVELTNFAKEYANLHTDYMLDVIDKEGYSRVAKELMNEYRDDTESIKRMIECYKKLRDIGNIEPETEEEKAKWIEEMNAIDEEYKDVKDVAVQLLDMEDDLINAKTINSKWKSKSTTIVVEPRTDSIKIAIKGREQPIKINNLLELIEDGKALQEGELISKMGINRCDPAILEALKRIGEEKPIYKNLLDEYINSFNRQTDKIDDIVYDFNNERENKLGNYKEIAKACKKYAKDGEKYGMATIEGMSKEGIWAKIIGGLEKARDFIKRQYQKRIESKELKEYRLNKDEKNKEKSIKKRNPKAFMIKMQEKAKRGKSERIDMSEAIAKLQAINGELENQEPSKEEEEVL